MDKIGKLKYKPVKSQSFLNKIKTLITKFDYEVILLIKLTI